MAPPAVAAGTFYVSGAGYGHGVGMSQYGAYGYALHGYGYRAILAHFYPGTTLTSTDPARIVRVLLKSGSAAFSGATRAFGAANGAFGAANGAGGATLAPGVRYSVQALVNGSLALVNPKGKRVGTFAAPLEVSGPGPLRVVGLGLYRGSLEYRPAPSGGVETIDAVGLDAYVRGVVAAEMPASWPAQALEAQAVAARTYALTSDVDGVAFGLYSDTRSQVYGGVAAETPATDAAAAATRGQILTYGGAPAITYFFSSSGGHTENVENVFPGAAPEPWLRGVPDPYDGAGRDPDHRWRYKMSVGAAAARLSGLVKGSLVGIKVLAHGVSPRIITAAVLGTGGTTTVSGAELERRFGLPSTWAAFTTIITDVAPPAGAAARSSAGHSPDIPQVVAETAAALARQLFSPRAESIVGRVFPASRGAALTLERRDGSGWLLVRRLALGPGGRYAVKVTGPGTYRVVYRGLTGPAVGVG